MNFFYYSLNYALTLKICGRAIPIKIAEQVFSFMKSVIGSFINNKGDKAKDIIYKYDDLKP